MDDGTTVPRRGTGLDGWSIAAALGLMAPAFLLERLLATDKEARQTPAQDLPPQLGARRDASPEGLATQGGDRGRDATSPAEIPAKGWKDILWRVYPNIGDHRILALAHRPRAGHRLHLPLRPQPRGAALALDHLGQLGRDAPLAGRLSAVLLVRGELRHTFNQTYGSLGAVMGFMTWLWISAIVILRGAELNAEMEHQTARNTTTGAPKPLGARGARMPDTVGAAEGA